ncbi:MAG: ELM1/GtrOC1 family putative glycosyltransferase [Deltaproteobacteria bacterium]|nr:ELM1/GtrOC1 family putative glycosyltransferase [Deltaproteobacteria bacterium]
MSAGPRTWLLLGEKPGDNAQARVLADALGWPYETRTLRMQPEWVLGKPRVRPSLAHLDLARSDRLEPPWPALLITVGRRLSSAALWVERQSRGATKLVLIGKPRRRLGRFALVVAGAQYRIGARRNVVRIGLPLLRIDPDTVAAAASAWRGRLAPAPRPLLALLVGGPTKALRLDAAVARAIAVRAAADSARAGGSLHVCTSRRTPPAVVEALAEALPGGTPLYRWRPDDPDNPYLALLGLADRFAVTADSVTMMVEVARLGRPLAIARLPARRSRLRALTRSRDLDAVARLLLARGLALELGQAWHPPARALDDDVSVVAARVRELFPPPAGAVPEATPPAK